MAGLGCDGGAQAGDVAGDGAFAEAEAGGDGALGEAAGEQTADPVGDGAGGPAAEGGGCFGGVGAGPVAFEAADQEGEGGRVADEGGGAVVVVGGDDGDAAVEDDQALEGLVEDPDLRAVPGDLLGVGDRGRVGERDGLVDGAQRAAALEEPDVLGEGDLQGVGGALAGLRGEDLGAAVGDQLGDPLADVDVALDVDGAAGSAGRAGHRVVGAGEAVQGAGEVLGADQQPGGLAAEFRTEAVADGAWADGGVAAVHPVDHDQADVEELPECGAVVVGDVGERDAAAFGDDRQVQLPGGLVGFTVLGHLVRRDRRFRRHVALSLPDASPLLPPSRTRGPRWPGASTVPVGRWTPGSGCRRTPGSRGSPSVRQDLGASVEAEQQRLAGSGSGGHHHTWTPAGALPPRSTAAGCCTRGQSEEQVATIGLRCPDDLACLHPHSVTAGEQVPSECRFAQLQFSASRRGCRVSDGRSDSGKGRGQRGVASAAGGRLYTVVLHLRVPATAACS